MSRSQAPRRILGIDTSSSRCEIALSDDAMVFATAQLPAESRPTATLVPAIGDLLRQVGWSARELDLVCVDVGPGSYTGLRVGLTCAKTFAFAAEAPLATVGSLEIVAQNVPSDEPCVEVAFDAARGQVFAARFRRDARSMADGAPDGSPPRSRAIDVAPLEPAKGQNAAGPWRGSEAPSRWHLTDRVQIVAAEAWARGLERACLVTGPALVRYRHLISAAHRVAEQSLWWPRAQHVIELGLLQFRAGPLPPYWTLEPVYLRPSAAEEKKQSSEFSSRASET